MSTKSGSLIPQTGSDAGAVPPTPCVVRDAAGQGVATGSSSSQVTGLFAFDSGAGLRRAVGAAHREDFVTRLQAARAAAEMTATLRRREDPQAVVLERLRYFILNSGPNSRGQYVDLPPEMQQPPNELLRVLCRSRTSLHDAIEAAANAKPAKGKRLHHWVKALAGRPVDELVAHILRPLSDRNESTAGRYVRTMMAGTGLTRADAHGLIAVAVAAGVLRFHDAEKRAGSHENHETMIERGPSWPYPELPVAEPGLWTVPPHPGPVVACADNSKRAAVTDVGATSQEATRALVETRWRANHWLFLKARSNAGLALIAEDLGQRYKNDAVRAEEADKAARALDHVAREHSTKWFHESFFDGRGRMYLRGSNSLLDWTGASDLGRALVEFDNDEPLAPEGFARLGMYVAGLFGAGKRLDERVAWIVDPDNSARLWALVADPFAPENRAWWIANTKVKERWQALAAAEAFVHGRNAKPIVQDCSASGLQIMAFLLRDEKLGKLVGLGDEPACFYDLLAKETGLSKDQVKAVALPILYNSDPESGRLCKAMREAGIPGENPELRKIALGIDAALWRIAGEGATALRNKLREIGSAGIELTWQTPSGFRVVQDARCEERTTHKLRLLDGSTRDYTEVTLKDKINKQDQARALGPNYVHSQDAALLHGTLAWLRRNGVRYMACAHDAFVACPNDGGMLHEAPRQVAREMFGTVSPLADSFGGACANLVQEGGLPAGFTLQYMTS